MPLTGVERRQWRPPPVACRRRRELLVVTATKDVQQQADGAVVADARGQTGRGARQAARTGLREDFKAAHPREQRALGEEQVNCATPTVAALLVKSKRTMQIAICTAIEHN